MSNVITRIVIPRTIGGLLKLAMLIYKKHLQDGSDSPLHALSDYNWKELGQRLEEAKAKHEEAEELTRRAELAYRERNQLLEDIPGLIRSTRDLLKGIFRKNIKRLVEWGFEVNDTPRTKKKK
ncbi:MAG: hypothetical protein ACK4TA_20015 [Saprospiraceae bacterium]